MQQAAGSGRETEAAQVEGKGRDREATESASAASASAASEAGPSSSAVAMCDTTAAANADGAAGGRAGGAATSAEAFKARGQPTPGPKGRSAEVVEGSSAPAAQHPTPPPPTSSASQAAPPAALTAAPVPGDRLSGAPCAAGGRLPTSAASALRTPLCETAPDAPPRLSFGSTAASPASQPMHDDGLCVVCMERRRSTVLVPCSHVVMCQACCDAVREARDEVRLVGVFDRKMAYLRWGCQGDGRYRGEATSQPLCWLLC